MEGLEYWSPETNPETGDKFKAMLSYMNVAHNGNAHIDRLIRSPYGEALARRLHTGFLYEEDPMGERCLSYYHSLGLKKVMMENDDYYTRWVLICPEDMDSHPGHRYPLVFVHHGGGNSIETDEFAAGYQELAAKEGFMVVFLQNTNWENTDRILSFMAQNYPLDTERVYMTGYSQGGYQVTSTYFRIPEKFAAAAPCGNDIYRDWDNFNVPYTQEETRHLTETFLPIMQIVGACEASGFAPVNDWHPRKDWGTEGDPMPYTDPRKDDSRDPTRNHKGPRRFSNMPVPPEGADKHIWMMDRLNKRMDTLGCRHRDPEQCISYLDHPEDEFHHVLGFYGDEERVEKYYGYKHYISDIYNQNHLLAFRYVVVENSPHMWPVMTGRLTWEFFKRFRRDSASGKIVEDPYIGPVKD